VSFKKKALKKVTIARAPASDAGLLTRVGIDYYSLHPKKHAIMGIVPVKLLKI
jgi:hypothetical protein